MRKYLILMFLYIVTGCVQYPMGLSKEQWNALPAEKQAEYQAQQFALDEE